jgi:aspartyl-tRNA(Asn)/glutamyl-tRNA(Gln) amidotransferase subunit C
MAKSNLTKEEVLRISQLADINLTESEVDKLQIQLSSIINHINELQKVDTSAVEPTAQTTGLSNVFREDEIRLSEIGQEQALSGSDKTYNGYFKVSAILSERTDK